MYFSVFIFSLGHTNQIGRRRALTAIQIITCKRGNLLSCCYEYYCECNKSKYLLWIFYDRNVTWLTVSALTRLIVTFDTFTRWQESAGTSARFSQSHAKIALVAEPNSIQIQWIRMDFILELPCHLHASHFLCIC